MSADDDYELSYSVDELELDLYQDEPSDTVNKPSPNAKKSDKSKNDDKVIKERERPKSKRPDVPLFRPRQIYSRGRGRGRGFGSGRGFGRGRGRGGAYRADTRRSSDSRRKDRSRSRSKDDLRVILNRERAKRSRSRGKRSRSRGKRSRSRDKRSGSRDKRSGSRDKRSGSRDKRSRSRDKKEGVRKSNKESKEQESNVKEDNFKYKEDEAKNRRSKSKESENRGKKEPKKSDLPSQTRDRSKSKESSSRNERSKSKDDFSRSRDRRSRSRDRRSRSKDRRSRSRDRRSRSRDRRSRSRDKMSRNKEATSNRRSKSQDKGDDKRSKIKENSRRSRSNSRKSSPGIATRDNRSRSKDKNIKENTPSSRQQRSTSRSKNSASQKRSKSKEKETKRNVRSSSREKRSRSRNKKSHSKDKKSRSRSRSRRSSSKQSRSRRSRSRSQGSRNRRSRSRGRRSRSSGRRSVSRGRRRSRSRDRRSRSRDRRSRSRDRRSRSRDRRSRSRNRSRGRRYSRSRSRGRSRQSRSVSRSNRRRYTRPRSNSSDVIMFKPRVELIDVDKYEEARGNMQYENQGPFNTILPNPSYPPVPSGVAFRHSPPPHPQYLTHQFDQTLLPPGIDHFEPPGMEREFVQPPPAPFISNQMQPVSQQFARPQFLNQPSPHGHPHQLGLAHNPSLSENFGYNENIPGEFMREYAGHREQFQPPPAPPPPSFSAPQKDLGLNHPNWSVSPRQNSSPPRVTQPFSKQSGVEEERKNQRQTLVLQRDQYLQKKNQLQKELTRLKDHRSEMLQDEIVHSEDLLKENTKLQNEVTQRLKAVENVIEMLSGLIKKDEPQDKYSDTASSRKDSSPPRSSRRSDDRRRSRGDSRDRARDKRSSRERDRSSPRRERCSPRRDRTPPRQRTKSPHTEKKSHDVIVLDSSPPPLSLPSYSRDKESLKNKPSEAKKTEACNNLIRLTPTPCPPQTISTTSNIATTTKATSSNTIYYDPELHWCSLCNVFPKTATDYLNHLHTSKHKQQIITLKLDASPWHSDEPPEPPQVHSKNAPTKRIPIRGVQFLVPSTGWYCRLCKTWIGDMHCAQDHLKGIKHTTNYSEYIAQNPHWEVDWLSDRTKSFERNSECMSRLRDKEETPEKVESNTELATEKAKLSALSDTLLAVLAQQKKRNRQSSSSSSSSSDDDDRTKSKKTKKKKSKKKKKKDSTPEKMSSNKVLDRDTSFPVFRQKSREEIERSLNDGMISSWMESNKLGSSIAIKLKNTTPSSSSRDGSVRDNVKSHGADRDGNISDMRSNKNKLQNTYKFSDKSREAENANSKNKFQDMFSDKYRDVDKSSNRYGRVKDKEDDKYRGNDSDQNDRSSDKNKPKASRWETNSKDQFDLNRKDSKDIRGTRDEEDLMSKKLAQAKRFIEEKIRNEEKERIKTQKKNTLKVFQRPESEDDEPEIVISEKKDFTKHDKPQGKLWFPSKTKDDTEEEKSPFEKQSEEIVKKKPEVKKPQALPSKIKLPFIGRMPLLKKRTIEFKCEEPKDKKTKALEKTLTWPNIPNATEGPQLPSNETLAELISIESPISSKESKVDTETKLNEDNLAEQDMDIANDEIDFEDDDVILIEDEPKLENKKDLPSDFQDALDLLFPEQAPEAPATIHLPSEPPLVESTHRSLLPTPIMVPSVIGAPLEPLNTTPILVPPPCQMPPSRKPPGPPPGPPPIGLRGCPPGRPPMPPMLGHNIVRPPMGFPGLGVASIPPPAPLPPSNEDEEVPPAPKRKNAPSQRMRRHMAKKRAEEEAKALTEQPSTSKENTAEKKKSKYEGMDLSDLAMLGIDEDDTIIV